MTDSFGKPVEDDQNSMTAGRNGPTLAQEVHLIEKLAHFDRERIPERVVHVKGAGAHVKGGTGEGNQVKGTDRFLLNPIYFTIFYYYII